ncbi:MAG: DUF72 domain-containing protein [Ignavibacteriales bacterium]|nr:DUF72 domain-containing protein [Ignavibacteriales bacterium]
MNADIHIGMGGWDLPPFDGPLYPLRRDRYFRKLEFYSRHFDSVEVNSTFYNTGLTDMHGRRWLEDVAANGRFMFTVKLFRGFTHTFDATNDDVRAVRRLLDVLAADGRLGGLLMQFPYHFTNLPERLHYVRHLGRVFAPYRLFLELRHDSWDTVQTRDALHEQGLHMVNVDLPRMRKHIAFRAEAWDGVAYFRMMGRNAYAWEHPDREERYRYFYSDDEMNTLALLVDRTAKRGNKTFVVFHNDPEARSIINGYQLQRRFQQTVSLNPQSSRRGDSLELPFAA